MMIIVVIAVIVINKLPERKPRAVRYRSGNGKSNN